MLYMLHFLVTFQGFTLIFGEIIHRRFWFLQCKAYSGSCYRSSHQRCSMQKGVLRHFTKFRGKHLCQSFFFNKVAGLQEHLFYRAPLDGCFQCYISLFSFNNYNWMFSFAMVSTFNILLCVVEKLISLTKRSISIWFDCL